jgi:hypothetical protein
VISSKHPSIGLMLDFVIIYFFQHIFKYKMIMEKNQDIKLCGIHDLVCEFGEVTRVVLVRGFGEQTFFLIELDFVIVYFFNIIKKIVFLKKKTCFKSS